MNGKRQKEYERVPIPTLQAFRLTATTGEKLELAFMDYEKNGIGNHPEVYFRLLDD